MLKLYTSANIHLKEQTVCQKRHHELLFFNLIIQAFCLCFSYVYSLEYGRMLDSVYAHDDAGRVRINNIIFLFNVKKNIG